MTTSWRTSVGAAGGRRLLVCVRRGAIGLSAVVLALLASARATQDAVANGDTRTLTIIHEHTKESATVTFRRNGSYDPEALRQLNWLLRDWRLDEPIAMEPRLFDIVWQVYREVGAREPIHVVSAYRAPETNAALRRRSRAVAEHSQHMLGKAMDFYLEDASMARVREIAMRLQNGGVGFYPNAYNPFVHLDAGSVRSWPRMPDAQLARLFPDGRTVHIPRGGKPMPGYEEAKATILARGGSVAGYASEVEAGEETGPRRSLWATLFGGGEDEDAAYYRSAAARSRSAAPARAASAAAAPNANSEDAGTRSFFGGGQEAAPAGRRGGRVAVASAEGVPPGLEGYSTAVGTAPSPAAEPPPAAIPLPPRRPNLAVAALAMGDPATALRPIAAAATAAVAGSSSPRGEMRPARSAPAAGSAGQAGDERAALRALFAAVATPMMPARPAEVSTARTRRQAIATTGAFDDPGPKVRMVFSGADLGEPSPGAFRGPAVAPLARR